MKRVEEEDVVEITGEENFYVGTYLTAPKYGEMFKVGAYYWLASAYDSNSLWYVGPYGVNGGSGNEFGVRPVVSLKSEIKTRGRNESGAWEMHFWDVRVCRKVCVN